jgi:hypothetical protein
MLRPRRIPEDIPLKIHWNEDEEEGENYEISGSSCSSEDRPSSAQSHERGSVVSAELKQQRVSVLLVVSLTVCFQEVEIPSWRVVENVPNNLQWKLPESYIQSSISLTSTWTYSESIRSGLYC